MNDFRFIKQNIYAKYLSPDQTFGLIPILVGLERCSSDKRVIERKWEHYALHYVFDGEGTVLVNGKEYALSANSVFLLSPKGKVIYKPNPKNPWHYVWIEFIGASASSIIERIDFQDSSVFYPKNNERFTSLFVDIVKKSRHETAASFLALTALLLNIFEELINESKNYAIQTKKSSRQKLQPVVDYIHKHYHESGFTPQKVADHFNYTLTYLSRIFKKNFFQPISTYIIQLRINHACDLLAHTELSVSEISYMLGYSCPFYFSNQFKKLKSYSPTDFRAMKRTTNFPDPT